MIKLLPVQILALRLRIVALMLANFVAMPSVGAADLRLLFMGDDGHHQPARRFQELAPALKARGILLQYTDRMTDLSPETLAGYDGVVLYANIDRIEDDHANALLEFVASGKGFIPLHCATFCWRNNPDMVALMGGQFQRHGGQVFSTQIAAADHPVMAGFDGFSSWDETYIHHLHNEQNRTVLEYRAEGEQAEGNVREPWTWVRTHGKGRVFYTAWGHDQRTFGQRGFHNLVERGIRWACGDDPAKAPEYRDLERFDAPEMTVPRQDVTKFEFVEVGPKIPNYTPSRQWGVQGQPKTQMQQPLPPKESMKHFVTPVGLEVLRFADERSFDAKPIAMTWDERGRLWICETVDYPNELGMVRDRIRICEDTDGDAVADKFTVFAAGLSIPTAIVVYRGGVVVQNGTETIYLKDTDGDDVADQKETLITGWSLGDTHGGVSNFRYGLDNWIWAMQGYNNSRPDFNGQQTQSFRQGFWRFKLSDTSPPHVTQLEFVRASDNNTWGLGISEDGLIFGSTANHNPSMFMTIPNRYYEQVRGWAAPTLRSIADTHEFEPVTENVRQVDHHGGYTAAAGHSLYTARAFPEQWWNKTAFVCGPTGHLIGTFVLRRDGAGYTSTSPVNLLASDDEWSAPVMAEVGPDGAVWVIDWYNYIVQHNPTPNGFETGKGRAYESDLRDKRHGRIYRVVPRDQSRLHRFDDLSRATYSGLIDVLEHPSMRWRLHAQRLLVERKSELKPEDLTKLWGLVQNENVDTVGLNVGAIHALHTLDGIGEIKFDGLAARTSDGDKGAAEGWLASAFGHASAGVRRNAIAVLPATEAGLELLLGNRGLFEDDDAQVRLQAVLTLADMPASAAAGELIAEIVVNEKDPVVVDALTSAAAANAITFLRSAESIASPAGLGICERVAEHVGRGKPNADGVRQLLKSVERARATMSVAILDGLARGLPGGYSLPADESLDIAFSDSFDNADAIVRIKLLRLAARCGTSALESQAQQIVESIVEVLRDEEANTAMRLAAAGDLVGFRSGDASAVTEIVEAITPQSSPEFALQLIEIAKRSEAPETGDVLVGSISRFSPTIKSSTFSVLLGKPAWAKALVEAFESKEIDLDELTLEQKQALRTFPDRDLRSRAEKLLAAGGGLPDANREKVLSGLMHITQSAGNVDLGRAAFKKACSACHVHGQMGKKIGPNLTGMAVHPKAELLTHILDPSRNVEGNYRLYNVLTVDGQVINGMLSGESRTSITIIDAEAKETSIPREDIEALNASRKSVMPEGFEKQLTEKELTDLLEFLTDKGQYVPLSLDSVATAISTKGLFSDGDNGADRMVFQDWQPKFFKNVPFLLTDPEGQTTKNIVLLNGPFGSLPPQMPKSVSLECNTSVRAIHLLSGVGGWNYPFDRGKTVSMIVRLHYVHGQTEDHELINGVHFADYIRRVDVPGSEFAFALGNQQIRYLSVQPRQDAEIARVELVKGEDNSSPIVMAVTIEGLGL